MHQADVVVRITGDCPLVDPDLVDEVIRRFKASDVDYFSNVNPPTYPDGLDIEVCSFAALEQASQETSKLFDREHVTPYLREAQRFPPQTCNTVKIFLLCAGQWMSPLISPLLKVFSCIFIRAPISLGAR